jgi:uncharacterized membrane protein HdeD (DUF308 family)
MSEHFTAIAIIGIIFGSIVGVIKIISDNRIKNRLIDSGKIEDKMKNLSFASNVYHNPISAIKWGLLLLGIGIAFMLGQLFPFHISEESTFGLMLIFGGIALLIYYIVAKKILPGENQ